MITPPDRPRPILHLYGDNPCGGVAYLALVEVDIYDQYDCSQITNPDGTVVRENDPVRCAACGRELPPVNISAQMVRGMKITSIPFPVLMKAAIARARSVESNSNPLRSTT